MTVGAHGGLHRAVFDGASVHAVLIGDEGLCAYAARCHQESLPMAPTARGGNMRMVDGRIRMAAGQHLVGVAVAVLAISGGFAGGNGRRMRAVRVGILRVSVAVGTENLL